MKLAKSTLVLLAATMLLSLTIQAKNEMRKAYIFGFASSFNDSIVYFTDIQEVDSAWFTSKKHFLVSRENYSYQLRDYLSSLGEEHRTCVVFYNTNEKKLIKEWQKLNNRYLQVQKKKNNQKQKKELPPYQIKSITQKQFAFQAVEPMEEYDETPAKPTKKAKAKKGKKQVEK